MDRQQLEQFFAYCGSEDADSLQLLDSYLQQHFPGENFSAGQQQSAPGSSSAMGRSEARRAHQGQRRTLSSSERSFLMLFSCTNRLSLCFCKIKIISKTVN
jgi:hypothetical protein